MALICAFYGFMYRSYGKVNLWEILLDRHRSMTLRTLGLKGHVIWVPVTAAWHILGLRMETTTSSQIWMVAAKILNKQLRTAEIGGPPAWRIGPEAKISLP